MSTKPRFTYTLVAYRSNGVDTCRNCVMGQSDSDFSLTVYGDAESLARDWARKKFDEPQGREYCQTDYTLLLNGHHDWSGPVEDEEGATDSATGQASHQLEREHVERLVAKQTAALVDAKRVAAERAARAAAEGEEAARREQTRRKEEHERAEFLRLQAKFASK